MYSVKKLGDVAFVEKGDGDYLEKVGDIASCRSGAVLFQKVGCIKRFTQIGRSKSLRIDRVNAKRMLGLAT